MLKSMKKVMAMDQLAEENLMAVLQALLIEEFRCLR